MIKVDLEKVINTMVHSALAAVVGFGISYAKTILSDIYELKVEQIKMRMAVDAQGEKQSEINKFFINRFENHSQRLLRVEEKKK